MKQMSNSHTNILFIGRKKSDFVFSQLHVGVSLKERKDDNPILLFHVPLYKRCPFTK